MSTLESQIETHIIEKLCDLKYLYRADKREPIGGA